MASKASPQQLNAGGTSIVVLSERDVEAVLELEAALETNKQVCTRYQKLRCFEIQCFFADGFLRDRRRLSSCTPARPSFRIGFN